MMLEVQYKGHKAIRPTALRRLTRQEATKKNAALYQPLDQTFELVCLAGHAVNG
jgi:hypothetical protein